MPYSTRADVESKLSRARLVELTDDENDESQVDARIDEAIVRADTKIDSYLRGRYEVPLILTVQGEQDMIRDISTELTIWELYKRRGDFLISESTKERYRDAMKDLENIQKGKISFTVDASPNVPKVRRTLSKTYTAEKLNQY